MKNDAKSSHVPKQIDVIMLTYNSVEPCLKKSLESLRSASKEADLSIKLIVVDKYSKDGTIELIKKFQSLNPHILKDDGNRATARQLGIEQVNTPLFLFLDSDVYLSKEWFDDALPYFKDEKVGAVWGYTIPVKPEAIKYNMERRKIKDINEKERRLRYASKRGLTHDTIIRTEAIKGINIPSELHVLEDHYIRKYIEHQNYVWINAKNKPYCYHYRKDPIGSNAYQDAYYGYYLDIYPFSWYLKHLFLFPAKLGCLLIMLRNIDYLFVEAKKEFGYLRAITHLFYDYIFGKTKNYSFKQEQKNMLLET